MSEMDRRKYKRLKDDFNVKIDYLEKYKETNINIGKSIDVSATGVHFMIDKLMPIDTIITIKFIKPKSFDFFQGNAKVAWCEEHKTEKGRYSIGVEFIDMNDEDSRQLDFYLSK
jgi:c-di-GMP-binding flagellar brake protein YcgR